MKYNITPVPAPRMTKRDTWKNRPCVLEYRAFRDEVRLSNMLVPSHGAHIVFHMPMPNSWNPSKRKRSVGRPHMVKPDVDNLLKALLDALYENDSCIWDVRVTKVWAERGAIEIDYVN